MEPRKNDGRLDPDWGQQRFVLARRKAIGALLLAAVLLIALTAVTRAQDITFFRIGTGTTGGTYFPVGGVIASAISKPPGSPPCNRGGGCGVPGLIAIAQDSSGSVENIDEVLSGAVDSGFSQSDIAYWAFEGRELYEERGPLQDLRAIAHLYAELVHIAVPADSDIHAVSDLAGKRVSLGEVGSGTLIDARLILDAYGLEEGDIDPFYLPPEPSADRMVAGTLDALVIIGGTPLLAVSDLARRIPIRLLPLDDAVADRLIDDHRFFSLAEVDAAAYPGVAPVTTIAVGALWLTAASADEALIYGITAALWHPDTLRLLSDGHPRGSAIRPENALSGLAVPLHPGAARYYREVGLLTEAPDDAVSTPSGSPEPKARPPLPPSIPALRATR
ncbi:MAG: TAXI family TRAP transporter solute-binding subunit [Inquilinaceae bacterium]